MAHQDEIKALMLFGEPVLREMEEDLLSRLTDTEAALSEEGDGTTGSSRSRTEARKDAAELHLKLVEEALTGLGHTPRRQQAE